MTGQSGSSWISCRLAEDASMTRFPMWAVRIFRLVESVRQASIPITGNPVLKPLRMPNRF